MLKIDYFINNNLKKNILKQFKTFYAYKKIKFSWKRNSLCTI